MTWCSVNGAFATVALGRCLSILVQKSVRVVCTRTGYLERAACSSTKVSGKLAMSSTAFVTSVQHSCNYLCCSIVNCKVIAPKKERKN